MSIKKLMSILLTFMTVTTISGQVINYKEDTDKAKLLEKYLETHRIITETYNEADTDYDKYRNDVEKASDISGVDLTEIFDSMNNTIKKQKTEAKKDFDEKDSEWYKTEILGKEDDK